MSIEEQTASSMTFKQAYATLQRHAETLRRQQEPNIDDLVNIVRESVNAYRVCKERIEAVELALQRTLGEADHISPQPDAVGQAELVEDRPGDESDRSAGSSAADNLRSGDFDDDIPF